MLLYALKAERAVLKKGEGLVRVEGAGNKESGRPEERRARGDCVKHGRRGDESPRCGNWIWGDAHTQRRTKKQWRVK